MKNSKLLLHELGREALKNTSVSPNSLPNGPSVTVIALKIPTRSATFLTKQTVLIHKKCVRREDAAWRVAKT